MTDLKGLLQSILCHLRLGLLGCSHFLWQVAQHKERLVCRNANELARVGPEDLRAQQGQKKGRFSTHATCDGGLRRCGRRDRRVWAGCRRGASVLLAPSRRKPIQSGTSPRVRRHQRYLTTSGIVHMFLSTREKNKNKEQKTARSPSAPRSTLKALVSLKFRKSLTVRLCSLMAYLQKHASLNIIMCLTVFQGFVRLVLRMAEGKSFPPVVSAFHCLALATNCCRHGACYEFPARINPLFSARSFGTHCDESCDQTNSWAEPKLLFLSAMAV